MSASPELQVARPWGGQAAFVFSRPAIQLVEPSRLIEWVLFATVLQLLAFANSA